MRCILLLPSSQQSCILVEGNQMPHKRSCFILLLSTAAFFSINGQGRPEPSTVGDILLDPSRIVLTGKFELPSRPTSSEHAVRALGEQIEQKQAADRTRSSLQPLWSASFWRYLPGGMSDTMNSPIATTDDPFFTPAYLTISARQLDHQLSLSEKSALKLFQP